MIWSKYNYLYNSTKYGLFVYNSRTNSFVKINEELFNICKEIENDISKIDKLENKVLNEFKELKILTSEFDENNYFTQSKYLKRRQSFTTDVLGLVIAPTYSCNFACPYCYETDLPNIHMSAKVEDGIIEFIKSFEKAKSITLSWHGGEPLLRFNNIKSLLEKFKKENINLSNHYLVTNGFLLDKDKIMFFKEHNLKSAQITIDGLEEKHNKSRIHKSGIPTFNKILKNIDILTEEYPECLANIRVNIHQDNKEDYHVLHKELNDRWKGKNINIYYAYVNDHTNFQEACLENKNKLKFMVDLYKKHGFKNLQFYPKHKIGGCTADYNNSFVIGPLGELYKCWVDLGRKEKEIGSVFSNKLNLQLISEYVTGTDKFNDEKCKKCFLFPVCDGGCNLYRLDYKMYKKEYNVCPIEPDDIDILLEMFYEQKIKDLIKS